VEEKGEEVRSITLYCPSPIWEERKHEEIAVTCPVPPKRKKKSSRGEGMASHSPKEGGGPLWESHVAADSIRWGGEKGREKIRGRPVAREDSREKRRTGKKKKGEGGSS